MKLVTKRNLLKSVHVLFSAIWLGSVFCMTILSAVRSMNADQTLQVISLIKLIDVFVAISAIMTFITGLLISWLAGWGFKTLWIKIKIYANIGIILLGWFAVVEWEKVTSILNVNPNVILNTNHLYDTLQFNSLAVILLVVVFFISVFKPWGKKVTGQ